MFPTGFPPQRLPSQQILTPDEVTSNYNNYLSDWQTRWNAYQASLPKATPSFQTVVAPYVDQEYNSVVNSDPFWQDPANQGILRNTIDQIFSVGSAQGDPGLKGTVPLTQGYDPQAATIADLGQSTFQTLDGYTPNPGATPDQLAQGTALNQEKDQHTADYNSQLQAMNQATQTQQNAFSVLDGGGTPGATINPSQAATATYQNVNLPTSQSAPNQISSAFMPWNTPGYAPNGGLGGLGGYNPNPWASVASGSSNPSNNSSGFGGPFSNKNPFSLGS